jgi:hypothetical protein
LSAVETYQQAVDKDRQKFGLEIEFQILVTILTDQEAASQLEAQMQALAETPVHDSGPGANGPNSLCGRPSWRADKAALKALKEGEESGLKEYQDLRLDTTMVRRLPGLIDNLVARQKTHI